MTGSREAPVKMVYSTNFVILPEITPNWNHIEGEPVWGRINPVNRIHSQVV